MRITTGRRAHRSRVGGPYGTRAFRRCQWRPTGAESVIAVKWNGVVLPYFPERPGINC